MVILINIYIACLILASLRRNSACWCFLSCAFWSGYRLFKCVVLVVCERFSSEFGDGFMVKITFELWNLCSLRIAFSCSFLSEEISQDCCLKLLLDVYFFASLASLLIWSCSSLIVLVNLIQAISSSFGFLWNLLLLSKSTPFQFNST